MNRLLIIPTKIGNVLIKAENSAITKITLTPSMKVIPNLFRDLKCEMLKQVQHDMIVNTNILSEFEKKIITEFNKYFRGIPVKFNFHLAYPENATPFQKLVWEALREIPYGKCTTYKEIAIKIGVPEGCRAVGGAVGANPFPILVPCHRVIREDGSLGGFSAGIEWKNFLLELEKIIS